MNLGGHYIIDKIEIKEAVLGEVKKVENQVSELESLNREEAAQLAMRIENRSSLDIGDLNL